MVLEVVTRRLVFLGVPSHETMIRGNENAPPTRNNHRKKEEKREDLIEARDVVVLVEMAAVVLVVPAGKADVADELLEGIVDVLVLLGKIVDVLVVLARKADVLVAGAAMIENPVVSHQLAVVVLMETRTTRR
jgi:hypothetical protein